ncbi:MAG: HlyC/CorC family transporter [Candidatus Omnitrophica bacterium]|nr:HlyC/CorC family transporter [Candidatus Omnitrophota bacterium]
MHIIFLAVLFVAAGFFSTSETALFSMTKFDKKRLAERHPHLAPWILDHLNQPRRTLATILIGNLMASTLSTALVTILILQHFGPTYWGLGIFIYTICFIVFFEIVPKVFAVRYNTNIALLIAMPLRFFAALFFPLRKVTRMVSDRILAILVPDKKELSDHTSEEELKALVKISEEQGVLDKQESDMIEKLFELGDRPIREIMTARTDIIGIDIEDSQEEQLDIMKKHHFSHLPVFQETPDHILGILSVQNYLLDKSPDIKTHMTTPRFIPESKRIDEVLEMFKKGGGTFAVCVDEHGGTAGIVTLEDILEEIFGDYYDEYAPSKNPIRSIGERVYMVEAKIALADFNEFFKSKLESEEATTLGGFILEKTGQVPVHGQLIRVEGLEFKINSVTRQRIRSVTVRPTEEKIND